jgi:gas vesicle protein
VKAGLTFPRDKGRSAQNATMKRRKYNESNGAKKGEFDMEEQEKPQAHFFMGFLMGGFLGALAGILFAPKSGKELRSDIKEKGSEVLKDAKDIYADASMKAKEIIVEAKHQAEELKKEADRYLSEARQKAKEILARVEK